MRAGMDSLTMPADGLAGAGPAEIGARSILPLTLRGAVAKAGGRRLVGPVDLTIAPTGFTALMGPNGAGKTTLLRLMHGLQRLAEGEIRWNLPWPVARMRQAYVFQTPVMMRRTVLECIAYPLRLHGMARGPARERAAQWAGRVGLGSALGRPAPRLSGGEKQKLALAQALVRNPEVLFLDEPTANLDGRATRDVEAILSEARAEGTRIVMATHDFAQARRLATDMIFLYRGRVHETGSIARFSEAPDTPEAAAFLRGDILE